MAMRIHWFVAILVLVVWPLFAEERSALTQDEIYAAAGLVEIETVAKDKSGNPIGQGQPEICSGVAVDRYIVLTMQECLKDKDPNGAILYYPSYYEAYTASPIGTIKGRRYIKGKYPYRESAKESEQGGKAPDSSGQPGPKTPKETPSGEAPGSKKGEIVIAVLKLDQPAPQFLPLAVHSEGRGTYYLLQSYVDANTGTRYKRGENHSETLSSLGRQEFRYVRSLRGSPLLQKDNRDRWSSNDGKFFARSGNGQYEVVNTVGLVVGPGALMLITEQHIWQVKKLLYGDD